LLTFICKDVTYMKFCDIGGIKFSKIVLGTCYFGTRISEKDCFEMMDYYASHGGNVIDTAFSYADWLPDGDQASERTIGKWLKSSGANGMVISTKAGLTKRLDSGCAANISFEQLNTEINKSLDALGISSLDVWLLHRDDENIPVDEMVDMCNEFAKEGKTKLLGVSNWRPERVAAANEWANKNGRIPFAVSQILWSAAQITKEDWGDPQLGVMDADARKYYSESKMPVMAFSALAKGFFSKGFESIDNLNGPAKERFLTPRNIERLETMRRICRENGVSPSAACLAYVTSNPIQGVALAGPTKPYQLVDAMSAPDFVMSPDDIAEFER